MKKEADKPKSYARTLIEVKRIHGEGLPGFRAMDVVVPKFMIGQKVWKHFANDVKTRTIKCPVCKERHVERKTTPIVAYCTIKEVRLFVTDATVKAMYVLDDDRTANEDQLFPTYDEALKDALAEIEIMGKVVAKEIAVVKAGIKKYRANIRK